MRGLHPPATSGLMVQASEWDSSKSTRASLAARALVFRSWPSGYQRNDRTDRVNVDSRRYVRKNPAYGRRLIAEILALLMEDGRRTYDDIARQVKLTAPSVKRRVDRLRASGALRGYTAVVDHAALGWNTEALVELFYRPGTTLDEVAETLREHPEVVEAWSVTGEADAIARVRTEDNADLERLIIDLQRDGLVERTRSQVVLSRLVYRGSSE